jgi:hypothetical protein
MLVCVCVCVCVCMYKKIKCTLVQALRLCTDRTAHRGNTGIALPFHDHGTRRGEGSASRPGRSLPPGKTRYPLYRRLSGPQGRSGQARKIPPPPGCDPRIVQHVASCYTDWATQPTNGSRFFLKKNCSICIQGWIMGRTDGRTDNTQEHGSLWSESITWTTKFKISARLNFGLLDAHFSVALPFAVKHCNIPAVKYAHYCSEYSLLQNYTVSSIRGS